MSRKDFNVTNPIYMKELIELVENGKLSEKELQLGKVMKIFYQMVILVTMSSLDLVTML